MNPMKLSNSCLKVCLSCHSSQIFLWHCSAGQKHWEESPHSSAHGLESVGEEEFIQTGNTEQPSAPVFMEGILLHSTIRALPPKNFELHRALSY